MKNGSSTRRVITVCSRVLIRRTVKPMTMNLRADDTFVEDDGWRRASAAYSDFLRRHKGLHVLYLEIGVGMNTPVIIKYPFWQMTNDNPKAVYACLNFNEAYCPAQIEKQSMCIDGDSAEVIAQLRRYPPEGCL